jgi:hypothetical protein
MMKQTRWITVPTVVACILFEAPLFSLAQELQTGNNALATRVAPGESLPLSTRLSNFGSNERVDVTIRYEIFDAKESLVLSQSETVAVETSASYLTHVQLPATMAPGLYSARISIIYNGQKVPATATQQFTVERKIFGIFESDFILDSLILLAVALVALLVGLVVRRYRRAGQFAAQEYPDVPKDVRVYFEIVSDAIQQMRYHEGDAALDIAAKIPGLSIDAATGRVLAISADPAAVIAATVSEYEKAFGKKLNLSFVGKGESRAIVR